MNRTLIRIVIATALLSLSGAAHAKKKGKGGGNDNDNDRKEWVKKFDHNDDGRWRGFFGKDVRKFKKAHPAQYEKLQRFCENATEKPNKFDVNFPKGEKEKKFKCKKKKVDAPYLKAWVKQANDKDDDKKKDETPTRRRGEVR